MIPSCRGYARILGCVSEFISPAPPSCLTAVRGHSRLPALQPIFCRDAGGARKNDPLPRVQGGISHPAGHDDGAANAGLAQRHRDGRLAASGGVLRRWL